MNTKRTFILVSILMMYVAVSTPRAEAPKAAGADVRVGIVLGNYPAGTDEPTNTQTARCLKAFDLYKSGAVNKLLVTGGFTRDYISEARMMKIALVTYGVPPGDIVEDELASSTVDNALFSARLFEKLGWEKKAMLVSQKIHLLRANLIFKDKGFKVKNAPAPETAERAEDFARIPDMNAGAAENAAPADLIIVYEPFDSLDPVDWPSPETARRLRAAAALYRKKAAPKILLYNNWYARGPADIARMMRVAVISLGVPPADVSAVAKIHYGGLGSLIKLYGDKSAAVLTAGSVEKSPDPASAPRWKFFYID